MSTRNVTRVLAGVGTAALVIKGVRLGMEVFGPTRPYRLQDAPDATAESSGFCERLACVVDAIPYRDTRIDILKNGAEFYPAELAAIDSAQKSINLEAFEFFEGDLTREFMERMAARARGGVRVRLIVDRFGSWHTRTSYFDPLRQAGAKVHWYHPVNWKDWPYLDNRTHRKLLVVDGKIGFVGGAGFADHWISRTKGKPPWRDTMLRVEGGAVLSLNGTFCQNWVGMTGEVLFSRGDFPQDLGAGDKTCMVVMSTPGYGATRARVLFQSLIEASRKTLRITSPYFLPDRSARQALVRAARERGVKVQVLTVGAATDHNAIRRLSEGMSMELIRAGVEFYEYQPGMIHAKLMTVDGVWTVAGSTNFDHRSFALNDEVNVAICDREVTSVIDQQFTEDLHSSCRRTARELRQRSWRVKTLDDLAWVLRREE